MEIAAVVNDFRSRNHPDWTLAAQVIEVLMQSQGASQVQKTDQGLMQPPQAKVAELRGWARRVRRFLLSGGQ